MTFWACAQLEGNRERLALHCLALGGFSTYAPRLRARRVVKGRQVTVTPPLFPGYAFIAIALQWHAARWAPGIRGMVMDGDKPARVPDTVIDDLKRRERNGLIELPPPPGLQRGDRVQIVRGAFAGQLALYDGMRSHQRVAVLLALLGRVELPKGDIVSAHG